MKNKKIFLAKAQRLTVREKKNEKTEKKGFSRKDAEISG